MVGVLNLQLTLIIALCVLVTNGSYMITAPREWLPGEDLQVCVQVTNPKAPPGNITVSITFREIIFPSRSKRQIIFQGVRNPEFLSPTTLQIPPGELHVCESIPTTQQNDASQKNRNDYLSVYGFLDGKRVQHSKKIYRHDADGNTVVQTDKHLYKPGQTIQFRVLTYKGPNMEISTESYPEIYITSPSSTRIAQWLDVANPIGLIHLSMQLAEETEEGNYTIHVKNADRLTASTYFKVEDYVLPRFVVTTEYVFVSDESFSVTACARYTFGEPVKGHVSWRVDNNNRGTCQMVITKNYTISGCSEIKVVTSDLRNTQCQTPIWESTVEATVTEEGTDVQEKGKILVPVSRTTSGLEPIVKDSYKKPNLPYTLKVRATSHDGSPVVGETLQACHGGFCKNYTTSLDGTISVYATASTDQALTVQNVVTRPGMKATAYILKLKPFFSPSNSSLLIYASEEELKCSPDEQTNYIMPVLFSATNQTSATISVQVMSRGKIQYSTSKEYPLSHTEWPFEEELLLQPLVLSSKEVMTGVVHIPLSLPPTASPSVQVLVWYVRDDGEVVSDTRELKMGKCLPNRVSLTWSTNQTQPGDPASMVLEASPNSICSFGVVDKSVELLSSKRDLLTVDSILNKLQDYNLDPNRLKQVDDTRHCSKNDSDADYYRFYSDYVDNLQMFDDSGLYVFTDLSLESRPCEKFAYSDIAIRITGLPPIRRTGVANRFDIRTTTRPTGNNSLDNRRPASSTDSGVPRTDFPETWLWDLAVLSSSGRSNQEVVLPDTITEWVGKAVCVHPQKGVGVSESASITTFTPFFLDLTLPPSIKRGEILPLKISVFNYLQHPLPVTVILEESSEYEILGGLPSEQQQSINQRESCVAPQEKKVHTIHIRPTVLGQVNISVSGYVDPTTSQTCGSGSIDINRRDALIKPLTVEAEGILREKSWSKYICSKDVAEGVDELEATELAVPHGTVEGSERAWVTAVGDLLAVSLQNLGSLIRMPYGCGEQNMINFAPNIFILRYLKATRQDTEETTEKLLNFMNKGYQRELLYRHEDGSFSAFGKTDYSGSTWLTAFVLKSFTQAEPFIQVDMESLAVTRSWLLSNYGHDICAASVGKVSNKGLKGGIAGKDSQVPLTAYVLISLLESGEISSEPTVQKGINCLLSDASRDPYTLALKAYALALARHNNTISLLQQLLDQATTTKNSVYWKLQVGTSKALAVETAGYAILAMLKWDASLYEKYAVKIVKWISSQRNGEGGFYSTQDTVVALQAIANYESYFHQRDLDVTVQVKAQDLDHSITIKNFDKLLQKKVSLPVLPTNVSLSLMGQGCVYVQTVLRYNDPQPTASEAFHLTVQTVTEADNRCVTKRISACTSYNLPDGESNMVVIEIDLISGYIPEKTDLKRLVKENSGTIKRYEVDGNKVSIYIEKVTAEETCVNFRVIREVDVENVKPGTVTVYDYYQPEFSISKTYNLPATSDCKYI